MQRKRFSFHLFLFFIESALISFFLLCHGQVPHLTMRNHSCTFVPASLILVTGLTFIFLLALWLIYSWAVSTLCAQKFDTVLAADFLTYLPFLFLSLTPLALRHYIEGADLLARLRLFGMAVILAVLYLKFLQLRRWRLDGSSRPREIMSKFHSLPLCARLVALFLASLLIYGAGTLLFLSTGMTTGGDEPHYLLITHSLLQDRDFDLANNYAGEDYLRFTQYSGKMKPHAVWGAKPGSLYSAHSPGVAIALLPFYAFGSLFHGQGLLFFIRIGMAVFGALFSLQLYLFARSEWQKENLALWLWFFTAFTSPVFFYSIHVYPEILVALLSLLVFRLLRFSPSLSWPKVIGLSLALASFIWFHSLKYIALFLPLFLYGLWALLRKPGSFGKVALFMTIPVAATLLYLLFQHSLYGSYSLSSATWARPMSTEESFAFARDLLFGIPWRYRLETLLGYFLDQRDGLLLYAPLYFFSWLGVLEMARRKKRLLFALLALSSPYVLVSAFLTQRTGYAPPARPLVAVIWAGAILLGFFLAHNQKKIFAYLFNLAACLSFIFVFLLLKYPMNLYQETTRGITERGGGLFFLLSNIQFRLPSLLPSFLKIEDWFWLPNFVWPFLILLFGRVYLIGRKSSLPLDNRLQTVLISFGLVIFFVWFGLYPRKVLLNPTRVTAPSGQTAIFYSISRSARPVGSGRFQLREDNRTYRFYFVTSVPIEELRLQLGSREGEYKFTLRIFDEVFARGKTSGEMKTATLKNPPRYKLNKKSYYELFLDLGKGRGVQTELQPYLLMIDF